MIVVKKEKNDLWRARLHETIYESNTIAGKAFDVSLLILIVASIVIVMLDLTTEMALAVKKREQKNEVCSQCGKEGHDTDAKHCKNCGEKL